MGRRPSDNPSPAAIRQRRYLERQDRKVFVWKVEVSEPLKRALKRNGYIDDEILNNPDDLAITLGWILKNSLGLSEEDEEFGEDNDQEYL